MWRWRGRLDRGCHPMIDLSVLHALKFVLPSEFVTPKKHFNQRLSCCFADKMFVCLNMTACVCVCMQSSSVFVRYSKDGLQRWSLNLSAVHNQMEIRGNLETHMRYELSGPPASCSASSEHTHRREAHPALRQERCVCVCVCVCVTERERERERVCVCVLVGQADLQFMCKCYTLLHDTYLT